MDLTKLKEKVKTLEGEAKTDLEKIIADLEAAPGALSKAWAVTASHWKGWVHWVVILALGLTLGWYLYHPKVVHETPAPAEHQTDGSMVLERKPETKPTFDNKIPDGGKVVREIKVVVVPAPAKPEDAKPLYRGGEVIINKADDKPVMSSDCPPCPPVDVDLSLVRMKDGTQRVVAKSLNGIEVGGLDMPIEADKVPKETPWAAGVTACTAGGIGFGIFVDRNVGPFRFGGEVNNIYMLNKGLGLSKMQTVLKAGVIF